MGSTLFIWKKKAVFLWHKGSGSDDFVNTYQKIRGFEPLISLDSGQEIFQNRFNSTLQEVGYE